MTAKKCPKDILQAFDDILYMAIRYANNRHTCAPSMVRGAVEIRAKYGNFETIEDTTLEGPDDKNQWHKGDNLKDLIEMYRKVK